MPTLDMKIVIKATITKLELDGERCCVSACAVTDAGRPDLWNKVEFTVSKEQHSEMRIGQPVTLKIYTQAA